MEYEIGKKLDEIIGMQAGLSRQILQLWEEISEIKEILQISEEEDETEEEIDTKTEIKKKEIEE